MRPTYTLTQSLSRPEGPAIKLAPLPCWQASQPAGHMSVPFVCFLVTYIATRAAWQGSMFELP